MLIHSFWTALSTYSTIPVPQFPWREENTRYSLCFFPAVGVFCGGALALLALLCRILGLGAAFFAALAVAIPLLISGGIHMDGFMDTVDALSSHRERERKLEIMKDSHCGAFAVMYCGVYLLGSFGMLWSLWVEGAALAACPVYVLSRAISGLCASNLPNARGGGMLAAVTGHVPRARVNGILAAVALLAAAAMVALCPAAGAMGTAFALAWIPLYCRMAKREFGGVTGDTSGFCLQVCETVALLGLTVGGAL